MLANPAGANGTVPAGADTIAPEELINKLAIPAFVIDRHHVITHWNQALAHLTGLGAEQMVGTSNQWMPFYSHPRPTLADLIIDHAHTEQLEQFYPAKYHASKLIQGAWEAEDFFPEMGAQGEWLSFTAAPLLDQNQQIAGAIETLVSISARKQAEHKLRESEKRYRRLSVTDDLTQLYNARQLRREVEHQIKLCTRYDQPMALAMFDLDHFKEVNDTHGHLFGDEVLRGFGSIIRNNLRESDTGFRYGGEEFILLMPFIDEQAAMQAAQRIHNAFVNTRFTTPGEQSLSLTVSAGVTRLYPHDDYDSLLQRADAALYEAKNSGRNQIVLSRTEQQKKSGKK